MTAEDLTFREVKADNWDDLVRLFEARGGPKNCWCMAWRGRPAAARTGSTEHRKAVLKAALESRVADRIPIGILAYRDSEPVAWCSIAPRPTYRRLGGPDEPGAESEDVWSLACFFVLRPLRGAGMTERLLQAAIAQARRKGARILEAYPVDPESPSYRYMGLLGLYEEAGFQVVGRAGSRRYVVRLALRR